jgi:hypothetical protein
MDAQNKEQKCRHSHGFALHNHPHEGYPAVYFCVWRCGYWLPFDPMTYPDGLAFTCEPVGKLGKVNLVADEHFERLPNGGAVPKRK